MVRPPSRVTSSRRAVPAAAQGSAVVLLWVGRAPSLTVTCLGSGNTFIVGSKELVSVSCFCKLRVALKSTEQDFPALKGSRILCCAPPLPRSPRREEVVLSEGGHRAEPAERPPVSQKYLESRCFARSSPCTGARVHQVSFLSWHLQKHRAAPPAPPEHPKRGRVPAGWCCRGGRHQRLPSATFLSSVDGTVGIFICMGRTADAASARPGALISARGWGRGLCCATGGGNTAAQ